MDIKEPKSEKFKEAVSIIKELRKRGFEAYLAGGCVRDMLLNKSPKDFDVSTSAKPEEIEKIFKKTIAVGKQFGVIRIIGKSGDFEVSTFRGEEEYRDKRHPEKVFWTTAYEDAKRRDFTINALFYDPLKREIIDYAGGINDLKNKIIRFVGDPSTRIKEDCLRILRAIRFKNLLNFNYEQDTATALKIYAHLIKKVSKERIKAELDLILENENRAEAILDLSNLGILKYILPEVEKMKGVNQPPQFHAEGDVFVHTILCLKKLPKKVKKEIAWALLFHDIGKPDTFKIRTHPKYGRRITFYGHVKVGAEITEKICQRLKFSKKEREKVVFLVREHLRHKDIIKMKIARKRKWAQHPWFPDLLLVWKCDSEASFIGEKNKVDLLLYNYAKKLYEEEQKRPKPPKLLVNGYEVMKIRKIPSGPVIGQILKAVEEAQLEGKLKTKRDALKFIKELKI